MKRLVLLLVVAVAVALFAGACGTQPGGKRCNDNRSGRRMLHRGMPMRRRVRGP